MRPQSQLGSHQSHPPVPSIGTSSAAKGQSAKQFPGLLEQASCLSLAKEPWTLSLPRSEGQHSFKRSKVLPAGCLQWG